MNDARIVKFYVLDENDTEVGRFVMDIDRVIEMYCERMKTDIVNSMQIVGDATDSPISDDDPVVQQVSPNTCWHKKKSDGSLYLRYRPDENVHPE